MGGGFCIKAVTRYTLLYDVCFSFLPNRAALFWREQIYFRLGAGAEGLGVNALTTSCQSFLLFKN